MNKVKELIIKNKRYAATFICLMIVVAVAFIIKLSSAYLEEEFLKDQVVDKLSFENADLLYEDGISTFTVEVHNENNSDFKLKYISINFKDEKDNITTLVGYIGDVLETDETKQISAKIDKDLSSSESIEYIINK